jgi:hypothetical protein
MLTRFLTAAAAIATLAAVPAPAQTRAEDDRFRQAQQRFDREYQIFRQEADRYAQARTQTSGNQYDPRFDDDRYYDPTRDYRPASSADQRVLSNDDRVYAGTDGRYYCRRPDGSTGLIVGGAAGGLLGNVIDGGRSRTVGTLLGAAAGALAGRAVDRNRQQIRCQ